jgi:hypothetical protein
MKKRIKRQIDLNELALQKLKGIKHYPGSIIPFPTIMMSLCRHFSIKKADCWNLLRDFENEGEIEIARFHGVRIKNKKALQKSRNS